ATTRPAPSTAWRTTRGSTTPCTTWSADGDARSGPRHGEPDLTPADAPRRAVLGEQVEERQRVERLGTQHAGIRPRPGLQQLQRHDGIDRGLPRHGLMPVLAHRPLVVDHVVQIRLPHATRAILSARPRTRARLPGHSRSERGRVRKTSGYDV